MSVFQEIIETLALIPTPLAAAQPSPITSNSPSQNTQQQARLQEPYKQEASTSAKALTAATTTTEWLYARDRYIGHIMACKACFAPTERYCATGAELRQQYNQTSMEQSPK